MNDDVPQRWTDPVIEFYKRFVDRAAIRENLRLTPDERLRKLKDLMRSREQAHSIETAGVGC
jgi:hypothetical protein